MPPMPVLDSCARAQTKPVERCVTQRVRGKMTASSHVGHTLMASDAPLATLPHVNWSNLELLPFGIVILDESGTVLYYNAREEQIAGRRRDDVLGRNFFRDVAPCTQVAEFYGEFGEIMAA